MRRVWRGLVWAVVLAVVSGVARVGEGASPEQVEGGVRYTIHPGDGVGASPRVEEGGIAAPAYPRLALWWPRVSEETLDDLARYDWLALHSHNAWAIGELRARKPGIILLNSTNACELRYDPQRGTSGPNVALSAIPPEWFLTQVGSTLTAPVDAEQSVLPVAATSITDGERSYALFVPGDTVLIAGESVLVEAVDAAAATLTVQRGYVRPAAEHAAGTRVAAHISFWPQTWMLNVSTLSPMAVADVAVGPEFWTDYVARTAVELVRSAGWDGILIDRTDMNQSWIIGRSTARTIDPDQSNRLLPNYDAFDVAWNAGLRQLQAAVRHALGPEKLVVGNWGMPNYDLLNGNNFENFPGDGGPEYTKTWHRLVFGPSTDGSYFDWMAQAQPQNLTLIQTYEDGSAPDPWGDGAYNNPCGDPDFVPNYRKMRFGLTTALLNDGYFSYEMHTSGHGALCLFWFDEYEGGSGYPWGGHGYLGEPVGPARRALPRLSTPNLLGDGTFEAGLGGWELVVHTAAGYQATATVDGDAVQGAHAARVEVTASEGTPWRVALSLAPVEILSGTEMTLAFWARADRARTVGLTVQTNTEPWETHLWLDGVALTPEWQEFELTRTAVGSDPAAVFRFLLGGETGVVWLDDVRLQVGSREVWRRDYTRGVALVNATAAMQTVPLDGHYRKIRGTQVPEVNDGRPVTAVMVPSLDGLILLRDIELQVRAYVPMEMRR
jgi:hypothetical protein